MTAQSMEPAPEQVMTVLGPVAAAELGIVLPHEHLFNDLSSVTAEPSHDFTKFLAGTNVSPDVQWALKFDPYCCSDNVAAKPFAGVVLELDNFTQAGGQTIVDATGSAAIGRDPTSLRALGEQTGVNVVLATGPYLEKFEQERLTSADTEELVGEICDELRTGVGDTGIRAGVIGEIGVSPGFTENERKSLRASALAQTLAPWAGLNIHMPGWQRRGDEVLEIVLNDAGVSPAKVSLAHTDPSGPDLDYQRRLLDQGVFLEFDMIGLDITFPGEGVSPTAHQTADAVARLIDLGYQKQILLSHDLFLKQMWTQMGGNGFTLVPNGFRAMLLDRGVSPEIVDTLLTTNPQSFLAA